jgi:hypothetical protein
MALIAPSLHRPLCVCVHASGLDILKLLYICTARFFLSSRIHEETKVACMSYIHIGPKIRVGLIIICGSYQLSYFCLYSRCEPLSRFVNIKHISIVTCHLRSQPIERFVAGQQLRRYTTVLETLLGSSPRLTMEVQLEEVFSIWSVPRSYLEDTWGS